jgi:hypothetical protein
VYDERAAIREFDGHLPRDAARRWLMRTPEQRSGCGPRYVQVQALLRLGQKSVPLVPLLAGVFPCEALTAKALRLRAFS